MLLRRGSHFIKRVVHIYENNIIYHIIWVVHAFVKGFTHLRRMFTFLKRGFTLMKIISSYCWRAHAFEKGLTFWKRGLSL